MNEPDAPIKILVIDSAQERQDAYREILQKGADQEITLVPADTGEKGLSLSRTFRPHCIILHTTLPDMDFRKVLSTLNGKDGNDAAVVMVSDSASEGVALEALNMGAQDYILADKLTAGQLVRALNNARLIVKLHAELKRVQREVASSDLEDAQTALASRNLFFDRMSHALILAKRNNQNVGLLMMELNGLKTINLSKGHAFGDAAIVEIAQRLKATLREADTIARFDGGKFAVILQTGATYEGAVIAVQKIIHTMRERFSVNGTVLDLELNIGISLFPNHGEDGDTLIHHADAAMAQAKAQGGGYAMFTYDDLLVDFLEDGGAA
jgi:diguanylate cyclase (GGDEF)-like protein